MRPRHDDPPPTGIAQRDQHDHQSLLLDLRTSLTVITGNIQLLERWVRDDRSRPPDVTLARLASIAASARDMRHRLQRLEDDGR